MTHAPLRQALARIDGRPYPAYRDLVGVWEVPGGQLCIDRVQGDPFAAPSRIRVRVASPLGQTLDPADRVATEDWLLRRFAAALRGTRRGSGRSGELSVYTPGPEICERSTVHVRHDTIEVRLRAGLPAKGRRVLARQAVAMFTEDVPRAMQVLLDDEGLAEHCNCVRTQRALRDALSEHNLVAFIADGSVLPRASGVDTGPLDQAVAFNSPATLRTTLQTPRGPITGMGIGTGITLIVGGGFHGKSTILNALARGHLDHIPGDGRERVVALASAMPVHAEDGRCVNGVDISGFLGQLPTKQSTEHFTTADASGSTSQSAALIEAMEAGSRCILIDEDRSATNWLVRDDRMAALVPDDSEPITPLVRRIRSLSESHGVSTILVCGGVSAFVDVADRVIALNAYRPQDLTQRAAALRVPRRGTPLDTPRERIVTHGLRADRIRARDARTVQFGEVDLDLVGIPTVRDAAHARTLALALRFCGEELVDGRRTVRAMVSALDAIVRDEGLDILSNEPDGALVAVRPVEVVAALSRLRSLRVRAADP